MLFGLVILLLGTHVKGEALAPVDATLGVTNVPENTND